MTYENNDIEVIVDNNGTLWVNEKHIEEKLGHKNLPAITNIYDPVYKKHKYALVNQPNKQRNRSFLRNDVINIKEQSVLKLIKEVFEGENMKTQCSVLGFRIDIYFHDCKLAKV